MTSYKIHFTDNYGDGSIECDGLIFDQIMRNLREDPNVENIWTESFDPEEGWQA